jgi:flagellar biosynthesis protein FliP
VPKFKRSVTEQLLDPRRKGVAIWRRVAVVLALPLCALLFGAAADWLTAAGAQTASTPSVPTPSVSTPAVPTPTVSTPTQNEDPSISIEFGDIDGSGNGEQPGQPIVIILLLTLLAVAPALLVMMTSFTRIVIVLSLTRNAIGLPSIPPNQVVVGLSLFLSLFVMGPTLQKINEVALQPLLDGKIDYSEAFERAQVPLKGFMLEQTRKGELNLFLNAQGDEQPENRDEVPMTALVPAFVLSELKTAFIIGFVVFVPFLIIDLVVSSTLMSMGMFMLPPVLVSLPFKLMLFVMVDGWALVVSSLLTSFNH